jgi:sugar lactone lactonase YvrE
MPLFSMNKDRILSGVIIIVSLAGILYFGIKAVYENSQRSQDNPFEYDIENFKKSGADLIEYSEVQQIATNMQNVYGIAVGADDKIYVSGDTQVQIFNRTGELQSTFNTTFPVHCLSLDENDDLYLGMNDHLEVYDNKGGKKAHWESLGEEAIITSIAVSRDYVFVADAGNHIVWKFDKSGKKEKRIGDKNEAKDIPGYVIPSPFFDVAIDPDGFLWVANTGRHSLENYTLDGDLRTAWGEFSMEIEGFCGCCNPSHFVILEDGSFVTSEKGIARVKVYNRLGNLDSVVAGPDQFQEGTKGLDLAWDSSQRIYVLDPPRKAVRIFTKKKN